MRWIRNKSFSIGKLLVHIGRVAVRGGRFFLPHVVAVAAPVVEVAEEGAAVVDRSGCECVAEDP